MVWNKSIYKGIRVKQPCLVLHTAKHCNKSVGESPELQFKGSLHPKRIQKVSFYTGRWFWVQLKLSDNLKDTLIQQECDVTMFNLMFRNWLLKLTYV